MLMRTSGDGETEICGNKFDLHEQGVYFPLGLTKVQVLTQIGLAL
jgi:hypothetical protein